MLKWFSISGIFSEIKKIRWSKPKVLATDSLTVFVFTAAFAVFFVLCTIVNAWFLNGFLGI